MFVDYLTQSGFYGLVFEYIKVNLQMNDSPVFMVDDDKDDHFLVKEILKELGLSNQLISFYTGEDVLEHLKNTSTVPFLILSDVNLPKMNGFELRKILVEDDSLRYKTIPFVFWSSYASKKQIQQAYDLGGHGFFIKETSFNDIKKTLKDIMEYWFKSKVPE